MKICGKCGTLNVKATNKFMTRCCACNQPLPAADTPPKPVVSGDIEDSDGSAPRGTLDLGSGCTLTLPTRDSDQW